MNHTEVLELLAARDHGVVSSLAASGAPQSAVVGIVVSPEWEVVFDTLGSTRKAGNLRRDGRAALVVWEGSRTVQLEGIADEPTGADRDRLQALYLARFPDGHARLSWPGITYFRIRPTWVRLTDFTSEPPRIVERRWP